ncbi:MAG TPA: STING domain-containing protein [Chthoniobacterales bacterium]|jgi:hypothetical protein|nr:STING domain-containing protein [Chthoniobacterales bacterium]
MAEEQKASYKIFINYRRDEDHFDFVHHIYSWFVHHYGRENVFMDFESIPSGARFADVISNEIRKCDALVVVIGPKWTTLMRKKAFVDDYVRSEISLALEEKKLVVPVRIKGAKLPTEDELPKECKSLGAHQDSVLAEKEGFIDSIKGLIDSIDRILQPHVARRQEAEDLDKFSPTSGLALGYYVNFLKPVLESLTKIDKDRPAEYLNSFDITEREPPHQLIFTFPKTAPTREKLPFYIIIPPRVKKNFLEPVKRDLKRAAIGAGDSKRPYSYYLDARETTSGYQLIDFPNALTVLENWIQRRIKHESLWRDSDQANELEQIELGRFERMLKWWAEPDLEAPEFKGRVQITRFSPETPELEWLRPIWAD